MTIALTTMVAASLAILVYIAVIITGTYYTQNISSSSSNKTSLAERTNLDSAMRQQIASSLDYVHKSDVNMAALTITLGGPHSVTITTHEYYIPTAPSFEQIQHQKAHS